MIPDTSQGEYFGPSHVASPMEFESRISMGKAQGREYERTQVMEESVREVKRLISSGK